MRPKLYSILTTAIEQGVDLGWNRGHKQSDTPTPSFVKQIIEQEIWNSIDKVFDFEDDS